MQEPGGTKAEQGETQGHEILKLPISTPKTLIFPLLLPFSTSGNLNVASSTKS